MMSWSLENNSNQCCLGSDGARRSVSFCNRGGEIPRSILKKALVGGPRGRKEEEAIEKANESFRYPIMDMINGDLTGLATNSEDEEEDQFLKKDETVTGKRLHKDHMLLSPKLKDLI